MSELWVDVDGYEGLYMVSDLGNVKSIDRYTCSGVHREGKLLAKIVDSDGYDRVHLSRDGHAKQIPVHRLVAIAFIPNPTGLSQINHVDEDKRNNAVQNLEWCDAKYNINYGTRSKKVALALSGENCSFHKLSLDDVVEIRRRFVKNGSRNSNSRELSEQYGVSPQEIRRIANGVRWAYAVSKTNDMLHTTTKGDNKSE